MQMLILLPICDLQVVLGSPFEISVYTGDIMYAGTNAGVYVVMHGQKETKNDSGETRTMDISSGKVQW